MKYSSGIAEKKCLRSILDMEWKGECIPGYSIPDAVIKGAFFGLFIYFYVFGTFSIS